MAWRASDNPEPRTVEHVVLTMTGLPVVAHFELIEQATEIPAVPLHRLLLTGCDRGLIECHEWLNLPHQVLILSPLGAELAGVRLSHDSQAWVPDHEPPRVKERRIARDRKAAEAEVAVYGVDDVYDEWMSRERYHLDYAPEHAEGFIPDSRAVDPLDALIAAEELERLWAGTEQAEIEAATDEATEAIDTAFRRYAYRKASVIPRGVPRPSTLLEGRRVWPPEIVDHAQPVTRCPVHTEHDMTSMSRYCLWCDASGADRLIHRGRPLPKEPSTKYEPGQLAGGTGRMRA